MCNSTKRGFTLIEIIIAISVGTLLILVSSASIRTGISYMQNGEERFDRGLREKVALNFFTQQLTSIRSYTGGSKGVFFIGNKDLVSFISPLSLNKYYTYGLMICAYTITKDEDNTYSLVYNEKRMLSNAYLTKLIDKFSKEDEKGKFFDVESTVFFQGYQKITIEYLGEANSDEEEESPWKESWLSGGLPKAIKITLLKRGETQETIAPIMVTS
ncbi:MAG: type II secretion system protein [Planctomycetes bacterium]|nr:type II secretion system protein [Planctomycetota bacterium]